MLYEESRVDGKFLTACLNAQTAEEAEELKELFQRNIGKLLFDIDELQKKYEYADGAATECSNKVYGLSRNNKALLEQKKLLKNELAQKNNEIKTQKAEANKLSEQKLDQTTKLESKHLESLTTAAVQQIEIGRLQETISSFEFQLDIMRKSALEWEAYANKLLHNCEGQIE